MRLQGKVVIVTGSTTGIGKAIAKKCVSEGAKVMIHGLEKDLGDEVVRDLGESHASLFIRDLHEPEVVNQLIGFTIKTFGKLDALVNNAAKQGSANIETTDAQLFREFIEINTIVPFLLIQGALPYLKSTKGCVLNIGSVNAYAGEPNLLPYSVSKGALMTLTRNLGDSLFRDYHVRVNQINPGWVLTETEMARRKSQGFGDDWFTKLPYIPSQRILYPEEIANAAIYWLEDASGPISGQVVDLEQFPFIGRNPPKNIFTLK